MSRSWYIDGVQVGNRVPVTLNGLAGAATLSIATPTDWGVLSKTVYEDELSAPLDGHLRRGAVWGSRDFSLSFMASLNLSVIGGASNVKKYRPLLRDYLVSVLKPSLGLVTIRCTYPVPTGTVDRMIQAECIGIPGWKVDVDPKWSPNGRLVVFESVPFHAGFGWFEDTTWTEKTATMGGAAVSAPNVGAMPCPVQIAFKGDATLEGGMATISAVGAPVAQVYTATVFGVALSPTTEHALDYFLYDHFQFLARSGGAAGVLGSTSIRAFELHTGGRVVLPIGTNDFSAVAGIGTGTGTATLRYRRLWGSM